MRVYVKAWKEWVKGRGGERVAQCQSQQKPEKLNSRGPYVLVGSVCVSLLPCVHITHSIVQTECYILALMVSDRECDCLSLCT